jgi:hypothetical protein
MFHGQGVGIDDNKDRHLRYFREINGALKEILRDENAPMVLAGAEYYWPIYREANTYPHLLEKGVPGSPDDANETELHRRVWEVVRPDFEKRREEALCRVRDALHTRLAAEDLEEIVPAAYHGRVASLFTAAGVQRWGRFDREKNRVEFLEKEAAGAEDLFDFAALHTFLNSGTVYVAEPGSEPVNNGLAAGFRY